MRKKMSQKRSDIVNRLTRMPDPVITVMDQVLMVGHLARYIDMCRARARRGLITHGKFNEHVRGTHDS